MAAFPDAVACLPGTAVCCGDGGNVDHLAHHALALGRFAFGGFTKVTGGRAQ